MAPGMVSKKRDEIRHFYSCHFLALAILIVPVVRQQMKVVIV